MRSNFTHLCLALVCSIFTLASAPRIAAQTCKDTTLVATGATFALRTDARGAYDDNLRCRWTIKPPQARQIMLQLTKLDIYEDDTLRVFGSKDPTRALGEITGLDPAGTYIFEDSTITVQFISGPEDPGYYREGGWTILYASSQRSPNIRTETDRITFDEIPFGTSSKILNTRITVINALNNVVITPPAGFKISASPTGPFVDTLRVNVPRDIIATSQLYVQFVPSSAGEFSGRISISIGSAETFINVSGIAPPAIYWEPSNGPFSGRVQTLGIAVGNTLLAGTGSGVYRSNSNGAVWLQSNTGLTTKDAQNVHSIATWQRSIAILTDAGLFRSQDSGRSWRRMTTNGLKDGATTATVLLSFAGNLLIGTEEGVYRFVSDAVGWQGINTKLPSNEKPYVEGLAEHNRRLFVAMYEDGVFSSADSGKTWLPASGKDPLSIPRGEDYSITGFATVGTRLYALVNTLDDDYDVDSSELYFSDDNGETWILDNVEGLTEFSTFQFYDIKSVGTTLYLATADGVFRRINAGKVAELKDIAPWQQINRGISETTAQTLAASGSTLYVGTYGGVFRSNNQGTSWTGVNQGLTASLVYQITSMIS
jgi:photosystem II stability/assembly factor-like uncharacterized protein